MEEVIWAVSDVHLGLEGSNYEEFAEFLRWASEKEEFEAPGANRRVARPTKLILLGDFLELWDPIDDDFKNTALQLFQSIKPLLKAADEVIFVTGNHDEALEAYEAVYPMKHPGFKIARRHYPDEAPRWIQVGDRRYFFLHGHQFDRFFLSLWPLSRLPTLMASANNALKGFTPPGGWGLSIIFLALLVLRLLTPWPSWPPLWTVYVAGILSIPRVFTYLQTPFWHRFGRYLSNRPKHMDIEEMVTKGYYDKRKDTITADAVVYGHTHVPEICGPEIAKTLGKTLINTGSWVSEDKPTMKNTVVVIDEKGAMLLVWKGKKEGFRLLNSLGNEVS